MKRPDSVSEKMSSHHHLVMAITLLAVLLSTRFGGFFSLPPSNISAFWPANALLFSAVFLLPPRQGRMTLLFALLAYAGAEWWIGYPLQNAIIYGFANVIEVTVLLWLLRRAEARSLAFDRLKDLLLLFSCALLASPVGGAIGAIGATWEGGAFWTVFLRWSLADFFGYCLCVPLVLTWGRWRQAFAFESRARIMESVVLLMVLVLVSVLSSGVRFLGLSAPLGAQFLPLPLLLWAALRFGPPGGAIATVIVASVAFFSATHGVGLFAAGAPEENVASLQLFFAALVISVMTIASLNVERKQSLDSMQQEVSERKRAEDALRLSSERLQLATRVASIGIWDWDIPKNELLWDESMYQLYGIRRGDFGGAYDAWIQTVHPDDKAHTDGEIQAALRGEHEYAPEFRVVRPDGSIRYIKADSQTFKDQDGKPLRMIGTNIDITERKQAEEDLRHYKDQLEETVQRRTAELMLARDAAEAANKAKSVFLANMSHELRTPLNAILGFSSMMKREPQLTAVQRENIDIINRSGAHLLSLINDVLEIAKIEAGRLQLEIAPFDLGAMVRDVAEMMQLRAREKGLRLLLEMSSRVPSYIKGDEARLRQILINLLGNAVKFTEQGGVTIRVGVHKNDRFLLLIEVEDSGPGISDEDQKRIFRPFVQLADSGEQKGTGLGLTITKQFVELMKGSISLESKLGKGSLFRVELPVEMADTEELPRTEVVAHGEIIGLAPGQPSYRVLIVEDQHENQLLLNWLMSDIGIETKLAENGAQCVKMFDEWHPDLIWMDRRMPVMDGEEATRRVRQLPGGGKVKIVAVTASAFREEQQEMLNAGMDDFVRKPYRPDEIYDCLARQLGVRYIYEKAGEAPTVPLELTSEMMVVLPETLRVELRTALESLDSERVAEAIRQVGAYDGKLQKSLIRLAQDFDYPGILRVLQTNGARQA